MPNRLLIGSIYADPAALGIYRQNPGAAGQVVLRENGRYRGPNRLTCCRGKGEQAGAGPAEGHARRTRRLCGTKRRRQTGDERNAIRLVQPILHRHANFVVIGRFQSANQQPQTAGVKNGVLQAYLSR